MTLDSTESGAWFTPFYDSTLTLTASADPAAAGKALTLTAALGTTAPDSVLGGGSVSFSDNGDPSDPGRSTTNLGYANVVGSGTSEDLVLSVPGGLTRGIHQLAAYYGGYEGPAPGSEPGGPEELAHSSQVRGTLLLAVQGAQTITFPGTTVAQTAYGATYTPQATSTFGLPVSFSIAPESSAVCTITGGVVSFVAGGTCAVLADQAGDVITTAAPQVRRELAVTGATAQQIVFTSTPPADLVFGDTYAPTATGGGSGNPVVFISPDCDVSNGALQVRNGRTCIIEANQAGGNGYAPAAPVRQSVVIPPTPTRTIFTSTPPGSPVVGDSYTAQAYTQYAIYGVDALLSLDPSSSGCTLGTPARVTTGQGESARYETAATVTYTGLGTCIVNADFAAVQEFIAAAETTQQRSGVAGTPQVVSFTSDPPDGARYGGTAPVSASGGGVRQPCRARFCDPDGVCGGGGDHRLPRGR